MDPFTVALAVFGVSKLTGSSTKKSVRNALLAAGGTQIAGMAGLKGFQAFGQTGNLIGGDLVKRGLPAPDTFLSQLKATTAGQGISNLIGRAPMSKEDLAGLSPEQLKATKLTNEELLKGSGFKSLSTPAKFGVGTAGLSLLAGLGEDEEPVRTPGMSDEDYAKALEEARTKVSGLTTRANVAPQVTTSPYNYGSGSLYTFNKGGIVSLMPKYSTGGINYLPSKITHDENDFNNYVRAKGYVEDGSGNGDKDEDTILAQLADGEFVSRSDAVLGAGILEGASPKNYKEMRKKGAVYFYNQQAQLKRVFDLLDASEKVN